MTPRPPRIAEWVVTRTLPHAGRERETLMGDLAEEFGEILATNGPAAARQWYCRQVLRSILPNLVRRVHRPRAPRAPHDRRGTMESIAQDLRYGWRMLTRRPAVATIAVASLGLGMALPAVVFSLLNKTRCYGMKSGFCQSPGSAASITNSRSSIMVRRETRSISTMTMPGIG